MHAVHGGQQYDPPILLSRKEQIEEAEDAEAAAERREEFFAFADRSTQYAIEAAEHDDLIEVGG